MTWTPPPKPPFEKEIMRYGHIVDTPWERMSYNARQTGRTWRMVEQAKAAAAKGRAVYILVHSVDYGKLLRKEYDIPASISIETAGSLSVEGIDWERMRPNSKAWPNTRLFVDHAYFERFYRDMLREYHAYDYVPKEEK